jgi:NMD protein affecting ribosome stability and mRNA decay
VIIVGGQLPQHSNAISTCALQVTVLWCKECGRYLQPPKHWLRAELESKELLTFCIKKVKGLSKAR